MNDFHLACSQNAKRDSTVFDNCPIHEQQQVPQNLLFSKYFWMALYNKDMITKVCLFLEKAVLFKYGNILTKRA